MNDLTDEQINVIFNAQYLEFGQVCDRLDMQMFARACIKAANGTSAEAVAVLRALLAAIPGGLLDPYAPDASPVLIKMVSQAKTFLETTGAER